MDPYVSEQESLCDSDWTDIASSKASEDNESLDGDDRPLSRNSHISSTDDNIDDNPVAWEGYAEESSEEDDAQDRPFAGRVALGPPLQRDSPEDQQVRAGLEQSMMSTLSASRSGSFGRSSIHIPRDLRLSFPDPLSGSRDTLNRSYENVDSSDLTPPPTSDDERPAQAMSLTSVPSENPCSSTMHEVLSDQETLSTNSLLHNHDLHIVLYGFSTDSKWKFVDQLLDRLSVKGLETTSNEVAPLVRERKFYARTDDKVMSRLVAVVDKTGSAEVYPSSDLPFDRPSLGIIFFPNSIGSLPAHTRYLPLIPRFEAYTVSSPIEPVRSKAEDMWEKLGISRKRLLLNASESSPILESGQLLNLGPDSLSVLFQPLLPSLFPEPKQENLASHKHTVQLPSPRVLQIFLVLTCALLGCVMTTVKLNSSQIPDISNANHNSTPTIPDNTWILNNPERRFEQPLPGPTPTDAASSLMPVSLKDFALTVFNPPGSLSVIESHSPQTPQPSASGSMTRTDASNGCVDVAHTTTDIVPLTFTRDKALSLISPAGKGKRRETAEDLLYELSLRMAKSITDLIDMEYVLAIAESLGREVADILAIIEELVEEIKGHGLAAWENPSNAVQIVRSHIHERNMVAKRNAKRKAKELSQMGERLLGFANDVWKENRELAKKRAQTIKKKMFKSEQWLLHEQGRAIPLGV